MLKGVRSVMVLLGALDRGSFTFAAIWPNPSFNVRHLTGAAERALKEHRGLLIGSDSAHPPEDAVVTNPQVAYPIEVSGKVHGVVVLEVD